MDLNLLKTFDAVMKSKSVNAAAEALNVTAPAVSHALNRLRDQYQDALFIRQGRGITPTSFALELHSEIQGPLNLLINGSKSRLVFEPKNSQRTFRISSHKDIDLLMVPTLVKYKEQHAPNITIDADIEHLNEQDRQNALRNRSVDVILATVPLTDHGYINHVLFEPELVVTASKNHPRVKEILTMEDFMNESHLMWKTQRLNTNTLDSLVIENNLPERKVAYRTGLTTTALMLASETDWLCVTSRWHAIKVAESFGLNIFPVPFETNKIPVYMTWHQTQKNDTGHQWLREAIINSVPKKP